MENVRVYGVEKAKGWDVLSSRDTASGNIPKTAIHVHIAWGDGKGDKHAKVECEHFLSTYKHVQGCNWTLA